MDEFVYDVFNDEKWWWSVGRRALVNKLWKKYGNGSREPLILDIGCGTGTTLEELQMAGNCYGVDISTNALKYCVQRGVDSVCVGDASRVPYRDERFDLVISVDVIEHVEDDVGAMQEMLRVTKPGGLIIFTVPAFQFLWSRRDEQCHHVRRYLLSEVKEKATRAGLQTLRSTYVNLPLLVPLFILGKVGDLLRPVKRAVFQRREPSSGIDYVRVPGPINKLLGLVMRAEARWLAALDQPLGTGITCVAVKPEAVHPQSEERPQERVGA